MARAGDDDPSSAEASRSGRDLTATTVLYLFAPKWAPRDETAFGMHVPGGRVKALDTGANLLNVAVWSLREQGLVEVEQLRPVEKERTVVMGGQSFSRVRPVAGEILELGGLEGALLTKLRVRATEGPRGGIGGWFERLSGDDEWGLRKYLLALDLDANQPWSTVASYCLREAQEAELVDVEGRFRKKLVVRDPEGIRKLEGRETEIATARKRYREREPDLDGAVISDCFAALDWAHHDDTTD